MAIFSAHLDWLAPTAINASLIALHSLPASHPHPSRGVTAGFLRRRPHLVKPFIPAACIRVIQCDRPPSLHEAKRPELGPSLHPSAARFPRTPRRCPCCWRVPKATAFRPRSELVSAGALVRSIKAGDRLPPGLNAHLSHLKSLVSGFYLAWLPRRSEYGIHFRIWDNVAQPCLRMSSS